jgi:tRNA A-37 threonylcarbamoyl transferase component Bud32/tetratricopeptide (TPR) repeat protein
MLRAGDFVGRYQIERRLGLGGMGTLYLAHDPVLDRHIALKFLLGDIDLPGTRERFVREARAAAALSHPGIVTIYDYGDYQSQPYIVMEYIHGETVAEVIRRRAAVTVGQKLRWVEELCTAVGYAHARGIIHRDIKPLNVMIDSYARLKVLDFGIARMRGTLTSNSTALIGTPGYCAPEQIKGGEVDLRSDLFSIGAVCYELLGYKEAFGNDSVPAVTNRVLNEEPVPVSRLNAEVDADLEAVVMKALQKPADARYQTADAFREALAGARVRLESEIEATTVRYVSPVGPSARSGAVAVASASASVPPDSVFSQDTVAGAVATPPPDPRRTDRENAARQRVLQVQALVRAAQAHLQANELQQAEEACYQALKLDDAHPEALAILSEVEADREHAVNEYLTQARHGLDRRDTGSVKDLLERIHDLDPTNDDAAQLNRELRLLRVDLERAEKRKQTFNRCIELAEAALAQGAHDEALEHARDALEIDPSSPKALQLQDEALGGDRTIVRHTPSRGATPTPRGSTPRPSGATPSRGATPGKARPVTPSADSTVVRQTPGSRPARVAPSPQTKPQAKPPAVDVAALLKRWQGLTPAVRWTIASVPALIVAVALGVAFWPAPVPPQPQAVVLDAVPWGLVTSIRDEAGAQVALPADRHTPFTMMLPPGTYVVTMQGPTAAAGQKPINLLIEPGKPARAIGSFTPMSAEEYFAPYLVPPAPAVEPAPTDGAQPSASAAP